MSNINALEIWQEQEDLKRHRKNLEKFVGLVEQSIIENKALGVISESIKTAILEKECFQKTVLLTLPLLGTNERKKYLIQQISKRINGCSSGQMEINKSDFLKMFLGDDYIEKQISNFKYRSEYKRIISKFEHIKMVIWSLKNLENEHIFIEDYEFKNKKIEMVPILKYISNQRFLNFFLKDSDDPYASIIAWLSTLAFALFVILLNLGKDAVYRINSIKLSFYILIPLIVYLLYNYLTLDGKAKSLLIKTKRVLVSDFHKNYKIILEESIKNFTDKLNYDLNNTLISSSKIKTNELFKMYFDQYLFEKVRFEQEFLPETERFEISEFMEWVCTEKTISQIEYFQNNLREEFSKILIKITVSIRSDIFVANRDFFDYKI